MASRAPFPTKDANFDEYITLVIPYLNVNANKTRLVTSTLALSTLSQITLLTGYPPPTPPPRNWLVVFPETQNPATANATNIGEKVTLRTQIEGGLRLVYGDMPQTTMTQLDRNTLKLPLRDSTPTHAPIADHAPAIRIEKVQHSLVTIKITDPANPHTQAFPAHQHGNINAGSQVGGTGPIIWDANRFYEVHRFLFTVSFAEEDAGKKVHFRARYINSRGEPGPWSDIINTIIT